MKRDISKKVLDFIDSLSEDHDILKFVYNSKEFIPGTTPVYYSGPVWDNDELVAAITTMISGRWLSSGENVLKFERELCKRYNQKHGLMVNSGSSANLVMIASLKKVLKWEDGDEIIVSPVGFPTTVAPLVQNGLVPVFVDIEMKTLNFDVLKIEEKITERTRGIFVSPVLGNPPDFDKIVKICDEKNISLILDNCDSMGTTWDDKLLSDYAIASSYSFYPAHHITTGEGGAILTNNPELYKKAFLLRKHGIDRRDEMFSEENRNGSWVYDMEELGFNYRITDFQAALGLSQLKKLERFKTRRREIVNYYNANLAFIEELILPYEDKNVNSNFHLYMLQVKNNPRFDRYDLFNYLKSKNYNPMVHYIPVHLLSYYRKRFGYNHGDFPVAEKIYKRTISIPLYPALTDTEVEKVVEDIVAFIKES